MCGGAESIVLLLLLLPTCFGVGANGSGRVDSRVAATLTAVLLAGGDGAAAGSWQVLVDTGSHVTWVPAAECALLSVRATRSGGLAVESRDACPRPAGLQQRLAATSCAGARRVAVRYADGVRVIGAACAANVSVNGAPPLSLRLLLAAEVSVPVARGGEAAVWPVAGDGVLGLGLAPRLSGRAAEMSLLRAARCPWAVLVAFTARAAGGVVVSVACGSAAAGAADASTAACIPVVHRHWKVEVAGVRLEVAGGDVLATVARAVVHFDTGATHTVMPARFADSVERAAAADAPALALVLALPGSGELRVAAAASGLAPILSSADWVVGGAALLVVLPRLRFVELANGTAAICVSKAIVE